MTWDFSPLIERVLPGVILLAFLTAKSLYRSCTVGDFYEKYLRFGLVLGQLAILKKKLGPIGATFEGGFFMISGVNIILKKKKIVAGSVIKSCIK